MPPGRIKDDQSALEYIGLMKSMHRLSSQIRIFDQNPLNFKDHSRFSHRFARNQPLSRRLLEGIPTIPFIARYLGSRTRSENCSMGDSDFIAIFLDGSRSESANVKLGHTSGPLISSRKIELPFHSACGSIMVPDSICNDGSPCSSRSSETKCLKSVGEYRHFFGPENISARDLLYLVIDLNKATQSTHQNAHHFSEDGHIFGRHSTGPSKTLKHEMEGKQITN